MSCLIIFSSPLFSCLCMPPLFFFSLLSTSVIGIQVKNITISLHLLAANLKYSPCSSISAPALLSSLRFRQSRTEPWPGKSQAHAGAERVGGRELRVDGPPATFISTHHSYRHQTRNIKVLVKSSSHTRCCHTRASLLLPRPHVSAPHCSKC